MPLYGSMYAIQKRKLIRSNSRIKCKQFIGHLAFHLSRKEAIVCRVPCVWAYNEEVRWMLPAIIIFIIIDRNRNAYHYQLERIFTKVIKKKLKKRKRKKKNISETKVKPHHIDICIEYTSSCLMKAILCTMLVHLGLNYNIAAKRAKRTATHNWR